MFPFDISLVLRRVSTPSMGKTIFFLFNWSLFQSRSYNCTWLVRVGLKKRTNARRWRASLWLCQNRRGVWLYNQLLATASQISSLQRRRPFFYPVRSKKALLEEQISAQRCCKCRAVIVRRAGIPCTLMILTLSVCHAWGMLALRVFQTCLSALVVSFLFWEWLRPSRPPVFFLPGICEKKQRAEDLISRWQASSHPHVPRRHRRGREHSPILFTQHDQRPSAVSDMISLGASDGEIDDRLFLAASGAEVLSGSVTDPAHSLSSSSRNSRPRAHPHHDKGCQWTRARMVSAEEPSHSRLDECFFTGRYQAPPSFPKFIRAHDIMARPPLISHPSFCFSCSHICWWRWRKRIRAPASSGWVCGFTYLPAHSYWMEGEGEPSVQAVQSHICTRCTHLLGGWTSGFSAALYGCALGLSGQDAHQWGSRSGCSFT